MTEMSEPAETPHRYSEREFTAALAVIEDEVKGTEIKGNQPTWQACLRSLHSSEGGDLSNGVLRYMTALASDEQRLGFVMGMQVGLLMALIAPGSREQPKR